MKGILCACLLASLCAMSPARAYEADVHYSTTYVLARAAGFPQATALTIASANQAVDENQDTVAALEVDAPAGSSFAGYITSSLRQAEKNLIYHCFSRTRGQSDRISDDVLEVMSGHFDAVNDGDSSPRGDTSRSIALGVALHCQQDAYAHAGFGGTCGPYPGSCFGHTHQTAFDEVVFRVVGRHYYNPDHPAVSGPRLLQALQATAGALMARGPSGVRRPTTARDLIALAEALRASGAELRDEVRVACNRLVAGKWLADVLRADSEAQISREAKMTISPELAAACRNPSLASATAVSIPPPRLPRLKTDASPYLVRTDGTYELVHPGRLPHSLPAVRAAGMRQVNVQLSHWSQLVALSMTAGHETGPLTRGAAP